jgi:hypothetical protein
VGVYDLLLRSPHIFIYMGDSRLFAGWFDGVSRKAKIVSWQVFETTESGVQWKMTSTDNKLIGLISGKTAKKKYPKKPKSEARKLIPPKRGKGRRAAAEEQIVTWIVAAIESFPFSKELEQISPVICLPCLDIKLVEKVVKAPTQPRTTHSAFTSPPKAASETKTVVLFGQPVQMKIKESGMVNGQSVTKKSKSRQPSQSESRPTLQLEPRLTLQGEYDLEGDLVVWMSAAFNTYINLAGVRKNGGRTLGYRMAQVAAGFTVMARGTKWVKEVFPYFVEALFEMLDGVKSVRDLNQFEYIIKNSVYLDVLAEIAEFRPKNGTISVNFERYYEDKFLKFRTT